MEKLNNAQTANLTGGACIDRPGLGQENSGIACTGLCLSSTLADGLSGGNFPLPVILC